MRQVQQALCQKYGISYSVSKSVVAALVTLITQELQKGNSVTIKGLGKFSLRHVEWYSTVGSVKNGPAKVRVHPSADYPKFKPSPTLKRNVWKVRKPDYGKNK